MMAIRSTHNRVSNTGAQRIGESMIEWAARQQVCTCSWEEAIELIEFPKGQLKIRCMSCGRRIDVIPIKEGAERDALRTALETLMALARSPAYRVRMTQMAMCGFLDDIESIISAALDAAEEAA